MKNKVKIKVIKKSDVIVAKNRKKVSEEIVIEPTKKMASTVSGWVKEFQAGQNQKIAQTQKFSTI